MVELVILLAIMVVIAVITGTATVKSNKSGVRFDERQLIARGKAAEAGYYTLMISLLCYIFYYNGFAAEPMLMPGVGIGMCLVVSVAVFAITGIIKDAFVERNASTKAKMVLFGIIGAINLALAAMSIVEDGLVEGAEVKFTVLNLAVGLLAVAVVIGLAVKNARQKKAAALEESDDE